MDFLSPLDVRSADYAWETSLGSELESCSEAAGVSWSVSCALGQKGGMRRRIASWAANIFLSRRLRASFTIRSDPGFPETIYVFSVTIGVCSAAEGRYS